MTRGRYESWGETFDGLYEGYEAAGKARRTVKAQDLWFAILDAQIETGTPYILYKDAANRKSNQQNLGTIRCSNLCTEILEYTSPDEVAVCNLASIALPRFVTDGAFDHEKLREITYIVTKNLNRVIDHNFYPVIEAYNSNMRHRPIGLGVQGLADVFILLKLPFDCEEARVLNKAIFETIYYAALQVRRIPPQSPSRIASRSPLPAPLNFQHLRSPLLTSAHLRSPALTSSPSPRPLLAPPVLVRPRRQGRRVRLVRGLARLQGRAPVRHVGR